MARDEHLLLGTVVKTHGVRGQLILRTEDPALEPGKDWESIFLNIDGIMVPFFLSSLVPLRTGEWIMTLEWYETKSRAESLVGYTAWIKSERLGPEERELSPEELVGFGFKDSVSGASGIITAFMDIPGNPVFEVECAGEKILVPAREEFITEADTIKQQIVFALPGGLI